MADWLNESQNGGEGFEEEWDSYLMKIKGKFKCHHCENLLDKKLVKKNYQLEGKNSNDGWTTSNGSLEFLVQEQKNESRNGT